VIQTGQAAADTRALDSEIDRLTRQREEAMSRQDNAKVKELDDQIATLRKQRESALRERQGVPQDW
jgi:hypothetical protein